SGRRPGGGTRWLGHGHGSRPRRALRAAGVAADRSRHRRDRRPLPVLAPHHREPGRQRRMTHRQLDAEAVTLGYGDRDIISDLSVEVPDGKITVTVGATACGRSALRRGLARLLAPRGGRVVLDGTDISAMKSLEVARVMGLLPQSPTAPGGITVADLVARGRYPHQGWFR